MSTAPSFAVRTALKCDLGPCAALFARSQQDIEPRDPPWQATEFADLVQGEDLFVAHAGEQVVGFLSLWRADAFVHFLHVAPPWRRRGVGRRLLTMAQEEIDRPLELKCLASNANALRFYQRLGWRPVNRSLNPLAPYVRLRRTG